MPKCPTESLCVSHLVDTQHTHLVDTQHAIGQMVKGTQDRGVTCGEVHGFGSMASLHIQRVPLHDPSGGVSNVHPQLMPPIWQNLHRQSIIDVSGTGIINGITFSSAIRFALSKCTSLAERAWNLGGLRPACLKKMRSWLSRRWEA
ncbi:MAG: hypothetical protein FRX49_07113 [Trebouxia sp. A1-2]|nr:MAG: hypothetical protein FRX49_07113 [Trebouxia sp. A1-2]